jgi:putative addiction module component (TIGR02574 family)
MPRVSLADVLSLSVSERIQLVEDIWDSIATETTTPGLSDAQRAELDRRLEAHAKDPAAGLPWAEVRQQILGRK